MLLVQIAVLIELPRVRWRSQEPLISNSESMDLDVAHLVVPRTWVIDCTYLESDDIRRLIYLSLR